MSRKTRFLPLFRKAALLFAGKVILTLVTVVFAASITVGTTTYQAEIGSTYNVTNQLTATDKGFSSVSSTTAATSCSSPTAFGVLTGTANNALTSGHQMYTVQVASTASTAQHGYNVTLVLASTTYGPVCITQTGAPTAGQLINCEFDVGTTLPTSPYSFKVTVA
jgi:hypothetical protein